MKMLASTALGLIALVKAPKRKERHTHSLPQDCTYDHGAPVRDISKGAGRQRKKKKRSGCSGCHEREQGRRSAKTCINHVAAVSCVETIVPDSTLASQTLSPEIYS